MRESKRKKKERESAPTCTQHNVAKHTFQASAPPALLGPGAKRFLSEKIKNGLI